MLRIIIFIYLFFSTSHIFSELNASLIEKWETNFSHYNPDIYYNLGVYYLTIGDTARAIMNLKRAYLISPDDKKIKNLLDNQRKKLDIPILSYEPTIVEKFFTFPFTIFSINVMYIIGLIFLLVGSIIISLNLIKPFKNDLINKIYSKHFLMFGVIIFIFGFIYILASYIRYNIIFDKKEAVVLVDENLYDIPSPDGIKISDLQAGTEVKILKAQANYYLISTLNNKEGYIKTNSVERLWK